MKNPHIRLPPNIIQAIEEVVSRGETAQVRNVQGIIKVRSVSSKLEAEQEI